jgi:CRP/FNR family transcriptional regulator
MLGEGESSHETVCDLIEKFKFFSDLDREEIKMLAVWLKAYSAPVGANVFQEGSTNACLCFIVEGDIAIFKETTPNEHLKIADIRAGGTIGEMGIIDGRPLSASAIASIDSVILMITRNDFRNLVKENGNLGVKLLWNIASIISMRLRQTTGLLAEISLTQFENK